MLHVCEPNCSWCHLTEELKGFLRTKLSLRRGERAELSVMVTLCSVGLRSGDGLGHSRIFHVFALINWVALLVWVVLHLYYEMRPSLTVFSWMWADSLWTPQRSFSCFCPESHHQKTLVSQCHWQPCTPTPSHSLCRVLQMMCSGSWAVPRLLLTFFLILVSVTCTLQWTLCIYFHAVFSLW